MGKKNILLLTMILAAISASALAPKESFDQWKPNTQKTQFWKNLTTVPVNWNVHDRKGNNSIQKTKDGILLNGLIESKHYPTKNGAFYEIKVRARGKNGKLKAYLWEHQNGFKGVAAVAWVLDIKTTEDFQEYTGVLNVIPWWAIQRASIALDGSNVEISDVQVKELKVAKKAAFSETIITIPQMDNVSINGPFDPAYWAKNGIVIKNGMRDVRTGETSRRQSVISFLADKDHFYIATDETCSPERVQAKVAQRDGAVYLDESLELGIISDATKLKELIYHIGVNFDGVIFDRIVDQTIGQYYMNFSSPGMKTYRKSYQADGKNHEVLILQIPYAMLKIKDPSKLFGMNVSRNYQNPVANSNLGGVPYIDPAKMTKFRVVKGAPALTWEVDSLNPDGRYTFRLAGTSNTKGVMQITDGDKKVLKENALSGSKVSVVLDNRKNAIYRGQYEAVVKAADGSVFFKHKMNLNTENYKAGKEESAATSYRNALAVEHYPFQKKINIRWIGMSFKEMKDVKKIVLDITGPAGKTFRLERNGMEFYDGNGYGVLPFTPNPHGKYTVKAKALDANGKIMVVGQGTFETKEMKWVGNKLGCDKVILPPYTPIKVSGNTVSCLIRDYKFGKNGLLAGMVADKGDVLEKPIDFIVETENGILKRTSSEFKFTKIDSDRVEFKAVNRYPGLDIVLEGWIEYDGFLWYTMKLVPGKNGIKLKKLALDIPYKDGKLLHYLGESIRHDKNFFEVDAELPGKGRIWDSRQSSRTRLRTTFLTQVWIGSNDRGLCWFAENDKGWELKKKTRALEAIRDDAGKIHLNVNFIGIKANLKEEREIKFGLLATPLAPEKTGNQTALNWNQTAGMGILNVGTEIFDPYISDLIIGDNPDLTRLIYIAGQEYDAGDTELKYFKDEITAFPKGFYTLGASAIKYKCRGPYPENYYSICYEWTQEMVDFYMWRLNYMMKNTKMAGIYVDNSYPYYSANIQGTNNLWYVRNGDQIQPGTSILLFRQLMKRVATLNYLMKKPYPGIVVHNTGAHYLPRFTFVQAGYGGEMDIPKNGDHFDIFYSAKPEIMLGVNWGIRKGMLSMLHSRPNPEKETRAMYACYKIYDCAIWNNGLSNKIHHKFVELEQDFGTNQPDAKFVIWRKNKFVKVTNGAKNIRCSYFERPGKKLFYMANHDTKAQEVVFTLGANGTLTDGETGKVIQPVNGAYKLKIEGHDFRCFVWKGK